MSQPGDSATNVSSNIVKIPQLSVLLLRPTFQQTLILTTASSHFIMQPEMLAVPHTCSIVFHQCFVFVNLAFPIFSIEKLFLPFLLIHTLCVCVLVTQLCQTPCNLMDYSLPGASVHGILQARILECIQFSSFQSRSRVQLFVTPWTAACQASLSITNSWGLPKLMSIESVMPSNHLIRCCPLLVLPSIFPSISSVQFSHSVISDCLRPHEL